MINGAWGAQCNPLSTSPSLSLSSGEVVRADVLEEGNGPPGRFGGARSKGCGIVEYSTVDDANRAIQHLNNTELRGNYVHVM